MTENAIVSLQDIDVKNKIRSLYLDGKEIKEIIATLDIAKGTWDNYYYMNKYGFRNFIQDIKRERMIMSTEKISEKLLSYNPDKLTDRRLATVQKEAEFIRETQGKDLGYSKRIETIGLNLNKTEPLDEEQKKKLDKLFKKAGNLTKDATYVQVDNDTTTQDLTESQEDGVI